MVDSQASSRFQLIRSDFRHWYFVLAASAVLALILVLSDGQPDPGRGWFAYFAVLAIFGLLGLRALAWLSPGRAPRFLVWALVIAALLRLFIGAALYRALPVLGYDEQVQRSGYLYQDAFTRDRDAWEVSKSDRSLVEAFGRPEGTDQYGGMMFVSALTYRYLGGDVHRPLLIAGVTSMVATMAVLFTWGFVSSLYGGYASLIATWIVALYPDFTLLSASQMREPFIVLSVALALYGYSHLRRGEKRSGSMLILGGLLLAVPISPPFAFFNLLIVGLAAVWERKISWLRNRWVLLGMIILAAVTLLGTIRVWTALDPFGGSPLAVIQRWFREGAAWQLFLLEEGSGWAQKVFELTPQWMHAPLATGYGVTQPFLPAALADHTGAGIWQAIAIYRSIGWLGLLILLLYGSGAAWRRGSFRSLHSFLAFISWAAVLVASYRAAGDLWDNPRYRAALLVPQAALAGWAWAHAREVRTPWLTRTAVTIAAGLLIFLHWFVGRYYGTPRLNLFETLGVIAGCTAVLIALFVYKDRRLNAA